METRITATELARNLSDILNRARYRGERFVVVRNGEPVATIAPVQSEDKPRGRGISGAELIELWRSLPRPDDKFADDLEEVKRSQPPAECPEWPN